MNSLEYYIPEISEFHIGFKFERSKDNKQTWEKTIFDSYFNFNNLIKDIEKEHIRVSYLKNNDLLENNFLQESTVRFVNSENHIILYWHGTQERGAVISIFLDKYSDSSCHIHLFDGYIKNSNELKNILNKLVF